MKKLELNPSTLRVLTTSDLPRVVAGQVAESCKRNCPAALEPSKVFNCAAGR